MVFNSIKEINRLRREVNSLLGKAMSNIYLAYPFQDRAFSRLFTNGVGPISKIRHPYPTTMKVTENSNHILIK